MLRGFEKQYPHGGHKPLPPVPCGQWFWLLLSIGIASAFVLDIF